MMRRVRHEDGFALASTIMLMVIVLLVTAVGATAVVRSFDEVDRDRSSTSAFEVSDAAIDAVTWRMNKQLTGTTLLSSAGLSSGVLGSLGCVNADAMGLVAVTVTPGATSCSLTVDIGDGPAVTCQSSLAVTIPPGLSLDLGRNLICTSTVNGATRKVYARLTLSVNAGKPTSLWERTDWAECPTAPGSACPPA